MPKNTFFNLPEEKRNRILDSAIDEFAENSYESASINQIVKNSDIAKGSFYQYFKNKNDLYTYLISICETEKINYIKEIEEKKSYLDDFRILREIYRANIKFYIDNPKLSSIINRFHKNTDIDFKNEIMDKVIEDIDVNTEYTFENIVKKGIEEGSIYYNVDVDLITHILDSMILVVKEYIKNKDNRHANYDSIIDSVIDLVENGIKFRRKQSRGIEGIF